MVTNLRGDDDDKRGWTTERRKPHKHNSNPHTPQLETETLYYGNQTRILP